MQRSMPLLWVTIVRPKYNAERAEKSIINHQSVNHLF